MFLIVKNMEEKEMKILICLGNPGRQYEFTRHNAAWIFIDALVERMNIEWEKDSYSNSFLARYKNLIIVKPQTFMNLSGEVLPFLMKKYHIENRENTIAMYDDINYEVGEYGVTFNKGTSHHNGAKSIDTVLKSKAYLRIRLGIGKNGLARDGGIG